MENVDANGFGVSFADVLSIREAALLADLMTSSA
jgi:hypothetical protein